MTNSCGSITYQNVKSTVWKTLLYSGLQRREATTQEEMWGWEGSMLYLCPMGEKNI